MQTKDFQQLSAHTAPFLLSHHSTKHFGSVLSHKQLPGPCKGHRASGTVSQESETHEAEDLMHYWCELLHHMAQYISCLTQTSSRLVPWKKHPPVAKVKVCSQSSSSALVSCRGIHCTHRSVAALLQVTQCAGIVETFLSIVQPSLEPKFKHGKHA